MEMVLGRIKHKMTRKIHQAKKQKGFSRDTGKEGNNITLFSLWEVEGKQSHYHVYLKGEPTLM